MLYSNYELYLLVQLIDDYEPGISRIIKYYSKKCKFFTTNQQLKDAVDLWCEDENICMIFYTHISYWDVSNITDMSFLFKDKDFFNDNISRWDVSNVIDMNNMFYNATSFNQPIGTWNVTKVTNMENMFAFTDTFNQPLCEWKTTNVTRMRAMFCGAKCFNQPLNTWDVSNVISLTLILYFTDSYTHQQTIDYFQSLTNKDIK